MLLAVLLPAGTLPPGDRLAAGLGHVTLLPGIRSAWGRARCPGLWLESVLAGAYAVRAAAPVRVVRGGAIATVAVGVGVALDSGDSLLAPNEAAVDVVNAGTAPVALLGWAVLDNGGTPPAGHSWGVIVWEFPRGWQTSRPNVQ
ncbi:MAG: hypothetical protein AVDCRST_MAG73-376 [uncultured Thermomicrobiales bacterium]|uniref:Uncharacterized protein n=1 Tax=uncultured Thermomicrobiales bacterium TaxID=1645740 RepID=A0A6J4TIU8_9BACT|nr:MAG: hypothetical protein AVDCRST_MAG73-376 [uncultured Thermomicrobiales bacterium]